MRFDAVQRKEIVEKSKQCLWTEEGKPGLDYLFGCRKLSKDIVLDFQLGYIPRDVGHMLAGRVVIPLFDASKNLIAINSRVVGEPVNDLPKYWHEAYNKSFYLYGLSNAIDQIRKWKFAIIVEGNFDVIQMHNHGIKNTVGISGTVMTDIQYATLQRYCDEFILIFDKDENKSGQKATANTLDKFGFYTHNPYEYRCKMAAVEFDEETDPDEYLQKYGGEKLRELIRPQLQKIRAKK